MSPVRRCDALEVALARVTKNVGVLGTESNVKHYYAHEKNKALDKVR